MLHCACSSVFVTLPLLLHPVLLPVLADIEFVDLYLRGQNRAEDFLSKLPLFPHDRYEDNTRRASLWDRNPDRFSAWDYQGNNYPRPRNERTQCNTASQDLQGASICDTESALTESQSKKLCVRVQKRLEQASAFHNSNFYGY